MSANNDQFSQSYDLFRQHLSGYPAKPTYEQWKNADPDDQAVMLYVAFYPEITLAWYNMIVSRDITYVTSADGVSTALQYLMKVVDIIKANPEAYSAKYIYTVMWRCIGCLPRNKYEMTRNAFESSNEYVDGDIEVDLWDLVPAEDDDFELQEINATIEAIITHMGPKAEKVVSHLINGKETLHRVAKCSTERPIDRLADVTVSDAEYAEIIKELKVKLAPYKEIILGF